jgi:hypothetical protein
MLFPSDKDENLSQIFNIACYQYPKFTPCQVVKICGEWHPEYTMDEWFSVVPKDLPSFRDAIAKFFAETESLSEVCRGLKNDCGPLKGEDIPETLNCYLSNDIIGQIRNSEYAEHLLGDERHSMSFLGSDRWREMDRRDKIQFKICAECLSRTFFFCI